MNNISAARAQEEEGMALTIHIIPTGDSIQPSGQQATTLEALHAWVARATDIKEPDQIILTSKGKHVQQQALLTEVCYCGLWFVFVKSKLTCAAG